MFSKLFPEVPGSEYDIYKKKFEIKTFTLGYNKSVITNKGRFETHTNKTPILKKNGAKLSKK